MENPHPHDGHHHHDHHHGPDGNLSWAFAINFLLSVVQVIAGVISGSLALVADAVHNLSDAASLLLALVAQKISRKSPDAKRTYGYKRVETLSAYTNYVILLLIALWLMGEAIVRFFSPEPVAGWVLVWVSTLAVAVNVTTVVLTYRGAQHSHNVRAAFLHNLGDALSSIGVIVAGVLIVTFGWTWADPLITLVISAYILVHVIKDIPVVANILVDGIPASVQPQTVVEALSLIDGVADVHHFHLRALDEHRVAVEAHIVVMEDSQQDDVKAAIKLRLEQLGVGHSTLEFEKNNCGLRECL